ncbi:MAG: exosome complex protein Rrp42 [Candidatus Anstonellales archaeon]
MGEEKDIIMHSMRKSYLLTLLANAERLDGRGFYDYRPIELHKGIIETAEGSALAKIGSTQIIAGIKFEVTEPFPSDPDKGIFVTNAELLPLASSRFEPGPPGEESIEFARVVDRAIRSAEIIDVESFFIEEGKVLALFLDLYVLDYGGNMVDAAGLAALAALMNTKIPKVENGQIIRGEYSGNLKIDRHPLPVSFSKINTYILVDPTIEEESASDAGLTVATTEEHVAAIQKFGTGGFKKDDVLNCVDIAFEKTKELRKYL